MGSLDEIIDQKIPCYFISPHLDDAILSAGGLLSYLSSRTKVTVITLFTTASKRPYTFIAKRILQKDWGASDAEDIFKKRQEEDKKACKMVNASYIHLGFTDATWRKKTNPNRMILALSNLLPETIHLYPYPNTTIIAKEDKILMKTIGKRLSEIIDPGKEYKMFAPIGVGKHIDHIIIRDICLKTFKKPILWEDFPYNLRWKVDKKFLKKTSLEKIIWDKDLLKKQKSIEVYKSQIKALFPNGEIPIIPEIFYYSCFPT